MVHDPERHHRHSIRLQNYPYHLSGMYSVTICTSQKQEVLGHIQNGTMKLGHVGEIVMAEWEDLPQRFPNVGLDEYVVMPNHFHAIVIILPDADCPAPTLGTIVGAFKSMSVRAVRSQIGEDSCRIWQRNYYEQIVRTDAMLEGLRRYIRDNPAHWLTDPENTPP